MKTLIKSLLYSILLPVSILVFASNVIAAPSTQRLMGNDRYQTAVAVSNEGWPDGADTAILTTGENFPDALSAAPLAHKLNAPILLTGFSNLNSDTALELKRLKVKKVYLIGGTGVISGNIESQLALMGIEWARLAGDDRFGTALQVAKEVGVNQGIFVTTGLDFPDALSIAPVAAAQGMPILLVPQDSLTPLIEDYISKNTISNTYILNGNNELNDRVISQFPAAEVITGSDPYERNINLIKRFKDKLDFDTLYFATGKDYPDALSASALAPKKHSVVILLQDKIIPYPVRDFLSSKIVNKINILGGYEVINNAVEDNLRALPAQIASITSIYDTVTEKQKYDLPKTVTVTKTNGLREEATVDWKLSFVNTNRAGTYVYEGTVKGYHGYAYLTLTVKPVISKVDNITAEIVQGSSYSFPSSVTATMSDGTVQEFPVSWKSNFATLNKVGTFSFQGSLVESTQKVNLTLKVSEDAKISFKDHNLEWVVRDIIGKTNGSETIYKSDVLGIIHLNAGGHGITDLTGLEIFANLNYLDLGHNALNGTKLTPLQKLTNLETLMLNDNVDPQGYALSDFTALKSLTMLTYLDVRDNAIADFTPLKGLTRLTSLFLEHNATTDYSAVRAYYNNLSGKDFSL